MKAIVFGGSGQMGRAVALDLLVQGWQVSVVTRGGRGLDAALLDAGAEGLAGSGQGRAALIGDGADAVFDPLAMDARDAAALLVTRGVMGRFVTISSAAVYADAHGRNLDDQERGVPQFDGPVTEDQPTVPPGPGYAGAKIAMERALLGSGAPVTILRPGAIHGWGARHPREWVFVKRALDGRRGLPLAYGGQSRFQTTAARGIASLCRLSLEQGADGVFNVADADSPRVVDIATAIGAALGHDFTPVPVHDLPEDLSHVGHTPWSVPAPLVLSTSRARALGWQSDTYAASVCACVDWVRHATRDRPWQEAFPIFARYGFDPFDYAAEDRAMALNP